MDNGEQEVEDISGLAVLACPEVGVVLDARPLVHAYGISFHNPFYGGLAVYDVAVCVGGDIVDGDAAVVDDGAALAFLRVAHFSHGVIGVVLVGAR